MKKLFDFMMLFVFFLAAFACSEKANSQKAGTLKVIKRGNCKPSILGIWIDEKGHQHKHGTVRKCTRDGRMKYMGSYVRGKMHGYSVVFHSSGFGFMAKDGTWKHGKQHGRFRRWGTDGKLESVGHWKDGKKHGFHTKFDFRGRREHKVQYKNGVKDGVGYGFDTKTGKLKEMGYIVQAEKTVTIYKWDDPKSDKCTRIVRKRGFTVSKKPCVKKRPVVKYD